MAEPISRLHLYLVRNPKPELERTVFIHPALEKPMEAQRGAWGGFAWRPAVQALVVFMLKTVAFCRRHPDCSIMPVFSGGRPSPAASVSDLLGKKSTKWPFLMFGCDFQGDSLLNRLIDRRNPDSKLFKNAPVRLWLAHHELPPSAIHVRLDDMELLDADEIDAVASEIERESFSRRLVMAEPSSSADELAPVRDSPLDPKQAYFESS